MWENIKQFALDCLLALKALFMDVFMLIFDGILSGIAFLIENLPLPEFMSSYSVANYIHADIAYFLSMSGFPEAMGIIGAAIVFRIIRRVITLGIW